MACGMERAALVFLEQGLLTEPLLLKFYFGGEELPFGLPPTLKSLEAYLDMLRGVRCNWFSACLGGDIFPLLPTTISLGAIFGLVWKTMPIRKMANLLTCNWSSGLWLLSRVWVMK